MSKFSVQQYLNAFAIILYSETNVRKKTEILNNVLTIFEKYVLKARTISATNSKSHELPYNDSKFQEVFFLKKSR